MASTDRGGTGGEPPPEMEGGGGANGAPGNGGQEHEADAAQSQTASETIVVVPKSRLRPWFHYGVFMLFAVMAVYYDPLNWKEFTSTASSDLAQRLLIGPTYPTDHRKEITVVLFGESTLHEIKRQEGEDNGNGTWPVSLSVHAKILRNILTHAPKAVMVDFIFPDQRIDEIGLHDLREQIVAYKEEEIPLFFARSEGAVMPWIRDDLYIFNFPEPAEAEPEQTDPSEWHQIGMVSVTKPHEKGISHGVTRRYEPCSKFLNGVDQTQSRHLPCSCVNAFRPKFEACPTDPAAQKSVAFTAAFQIYRTLKDTRPVEIDPQRPEDMVIIWSNRANELNDSWMRLPGDQREPFCKDVSIGVFKVAGAVFDTEKFKQRCPFANTIPAHNVLYYWDDEEIKKHLERKIVFYGGDLAGLSDLIRAPTHERLPGVYHHAMALDNLLTFNGGYKRSHNDLDGGRSLWRWADTVIAALIAAAVVTFARSRPVIRATLGPKERAHGLNYLMIRWRRSWPWIVFNFAAFVVYLAICALLYSGVGLAPIDWIGAFGMTLGLSGLAKARFAEGIATQLAEEILPWLKRAVFREEGV